MFTTESPTQFNTNYPASRTAIAVDSSNAVDYAFVAGGELLYAEKVSVGWTNTDPDLAEFTSVNYDSAYDLLIAATGNGATSAVYLAYSFDPDGPISPSPPQARFGSKNGTQWSFDDVPALPIALAVDSTGAPLLLTKDEVLQRKAASWTHVNVPIASTGTPAGIATDAAGAWYVVGVTGTEVRASRRDPVGTWVTETVAGANAISARIAFAAGTVHVSYKGSNGLHYARRLGKTWSDHVVTDVVAQHAMAIDSCGSPHFAVWTDSIPTMLSQQFHTEYRRWTAAGWRMGDVGQSGCGFGDGVDIALTTSTAKLSYFDCGFALTTVPLK
jgi:hypothetical protein